MLFNIIEVSVETYILFTRTFSEAENEINQYCSLFFSILINLHFFLFSFSLPFILIRSPHWVCHEAPSITKKFHYLVIYVISYTLYLLHFRFVTVSDYYWIDLLPNTGTACFIANSLFSFLKMYVYLKSVYIDILINILVLQ